MTSNNNPLLSKLYIHVDVGGGETMVAGQLIVDRVRRTGAFKYARGYCRDERAYPLDPINLPLVEGAIYETPITRDNLGVAGALLDAGPDDWGRRVLMALLDPPPSNDLEFLLSGSGNGTGTIFFTESRGGCAMQEVPVKMLPKEFQSLEDIMETAIRLDEGLPVEKEKAMFFEYGSGLGGVRPKTFVDEVQYNKELGEKRVDRWIVKFPRKTDLVDHCLLEHATMKMAKEAGCDVVDTKIMETARGPVLLVKRFDVETDGERHHVVSAKSLIGPMPENAGARAELESYPNIGRIIGQVSESSEQETRELFRRMLFNIAVGNVDDHPKNHSFSKPPGKKQMQLTPAYDVLPTVGIEGSPQAISVGPFGGHQNPKAIASCAEAMGIGEEEAEEIAQDVLAATKDWEEKMLDEGLTPKEVNIVRKSMASRAHVQAYLASMGSEEREREKRTKGISMSR
ncbi:type II toxin-antitoxin system HipA family toxin [Marinimicrobium sp. ABcell2]|uniref:type II toxin-antitoxin system HipA family toxin n=1 Tax=Marinimicrobium sp. ABcell2 TaxID=3069751 RepID=UPI0027AEAF78|nr:HipA domain-containing protein [Marinimicrobium sp. ABcell2]MDQ2077412.1 HipA domain-containing protein [Marinimicrobium sp. ABcell2]